MPLLGSLELGRIPRIAVPLSDAELKTDASRARHLADVFELRIDRFERHDPGYVRGVCEKARRHNVPILATVRESSQGGEGLLDDEQRLAIFETVVPLVDGLDIEFHSPIRDYVVGLGHRLQKLVIVSHHDFHRTPPSSDLSSMIDVAKHGGADVVKLAVTADARADVDRLLALLLEQRAKHLILIAMGTYGVASRVFFPLLGSLLTYGFVRRSVAPGQLSLRELVAELRRYSPEFVHDRTRRFPPA